MSKFDNILTFVLAFCLSGMFSYEYNKWLVKGRLYNYNAKAWLYLQPIYTWWPQSCAGFTYTFHILALIRFSGMSLAFVCSYTATSMKRHGRFSLATNMLVQAWICPGSGASLPSCPHGAQGGNASLGTPLLQPPIPLLQRSTQPPTQAAVELCCEPRQ